MTLGHANVTPVMRTYPAGPRRAVLGLFMAVLALLGQITLAPITPGIAALPDAALFGDVAICHSGAPAGSDSGSPAGHAQHGKQCALCPVCHALAAAAFLPVPESEPPAPAMALAAQHTRPPPARAPPIAAVLAATYPTGPPNLA